MKSVKAALAQAYLCFCAMTGAPQGSSQQTIERVTAAGNGSSLQQAWGRALASGTRDVPDCRVGARVADADHGRPLIVLDLGHGFTSTPERTALGTADAPQPGLKDHGTVSRRGRLWETDVIDPLGDALRNELHARGYDVTLTREPGKVFTGSADRFTTLASRGYYAAYASEETGRRVLLLSLHVEPGQGGHTSYFQNSQYGVAGRESQDFARDIANTYRLGARASIVNHTTWNNRMMHSFAAAENACADVRGAAALLELGDINDPRDIAAFRAMIADPKPVAIRIADGIDRHVAATASAQMEASMVSTLPRGLDRIQAQRHAHPRHIAAIRHHRDATLS